MFLTFSQLPNKYIIKSNKTQIHKNPNSQYPTKKKIIKSKINPKSENNKTRTTHATTTTTRKSEIKKSKRIGDEIDPEQADRRFGGTISGLTNGATISGFATIGDEWV